MRVITSDIEDLTQGIGTLSFAQKQAFVLLARKLDSIEKKLDKLINTKIK